VKGPFPKLLDLQVETEEARLDFIRTDLGVCFTFADIVGTEYKMGNREHAERALAEAEKGYSALLRLIPQAKGLQRETQNELRTKLKQLRERPDRLKRPR